MHRILLTLLCSVMLFCCGIDRSYAQENVHKIAGLAAPQRRNDPFTLVSFQLYCLGDR